MAMLRRRDALGRSSSLPHRAARELAPPPARRGYRVPAHRDRLLRARLGHKRLRFTEAERRLLAEKGKPLGRKLLAEVASLATPEIILRWYRERVAAKYDGSRARGAPGRPPARGDKIAELRRWPARIRPGGTPGF